jgi:hypothetical protein
MVEPVALVDGDRGYIGVNNRLDPGILPQGYVSDAINRRFDRGTIKTRFGCVRPEWGGLPQVGSFMVDVDQGATDVKPDTFRQPLRLASITADGLQPGTLVLTANNEFIDVSSTSITADDTSITVDSAGVYNVSKAAYKNIYGTQGFVVTGFANPLGEIVGTGVFADPGTGGSVLLCAVNSPREDGGNGRVYALQSGVAPAEVPMNGHDFDGTVRFIQAFDGVVMLRHGNAVYYFGGDKIQSDSITLGADLPFTTGTRVQVTSVDDWPLFASIFPTSYYYVRVSGRSVTLHETAVDAVAGVNMIPLSPMPASYRYKLTRVDSVSSVDNADRNNGVPLIMQGEQDGTEPLDAGFVSVPSNLTLTGIASNVFEVRQHRFMTGDAVKFSEIAGFTGVTDGATYYARVLGQNSFTLYPTQVDALAGTTSPISITVTGSIGAVVRKTAASGSPMPPAREGVYFGSRLFLIYGRDLLAVSDILDPLHYSPFSSEYLLNSGTDDKVVALVPFNETTLIVFKERSVLALANVYGDLSQMRLTEITREYGCVSPLSIASTGSDVVWLSQRGVVSLQQTESGVTQSVVLPLSDDIQGYIDEIDYAGAASACGAYFGNRYFLTVTLLDGSRSTLVYSFLNKAWEGRWSGDYLAPVEFRQFRSWQDNILCWADRSGYVHHFSNTSIDRLNSGETAHIQTDVTTRGYTFGLPIHKQFNRVDMEVETWMPSYSVEALLDGPYEVTNLVTNQTRDRSRYFSYGRGRYLTDNSRDDWNEPYRQDYSTPVGFVCGTKGVRPKVRQRYLHRLRLNRRHGNYVQVRVTTSQGDVDIKSMAFDGLDWRTAGGKDN